VIVLFFCPRSSERDAMGHRTMILNHRVFFSSHLFITNDMGCLLNRTPLVLVIVFALSHMSFRYTNRTVYPSTVTLHIDAYFA